MTETTNGSEPKFWTMGELRDWLADGNDVSDEEFTRQERETLAQEFGVGEEGFWNARPLLAHVRDYARSHEAGPWAVLGGVLIGAAMRVPPNVVASYRPDNRGACPLNLYVGLVGDAGTGKGRADAASRSALLWPDPVVPRPPGSGEGIASLFVHRNDDGEWEQHEWRGFINAPDVDKLKVLGGRAGATLIPELLSAFSGETFGSTNADATRNRVVYEHSYRFCLETGVQPARSEFIIGTAAGDNGLDRRFLLLPVLDPDMPDTLPPPVAPMACALPYLPRADEFTWLDVPASVHEERHAAIVRQNRGEDVNVNRYDLQLRITALLALLDGRTSIVGEDWDLAAVIVDKSEDTADACRLALARASVAEARQRSALRNVDAVIDRLAESLANFIADAGESGATKGDLMIRVTPTRRDYIGEALDLLERSGRIIKTGSRWRTAQG